MDCNKGVENGERYDFVEGMEMEGGALVLMEELWLPAGLMK